MLRFKTNKDKKFFIETKTQIGYKYNTFSVEPISKEQLSDIINELIIYSITFDIRIFL